MPKKTVRAKIPVGHPEKLSDLVKDVWKRHENLGASSPFHGSTIINMTRYEQLKNEAIEKRERALELYAEAQALMEESRKAFGTDIGQTINTPNTLYFMLNNIKHMLLVEHKGNEEALSPWGFNVVIGSASVGAKKKKKQ
jgi:hypothetical protein